MSTPYSQAKFDAHPKDCGSLPSFKFFRPGGVCCISCYDICSDCDAPFATEALTFIDGGPVEEDEWLCECCKRARAAALDAQVETETEEQK